MLKELHIHNYALFEEVHIQLGPNFNVFTGETGAGKSLLVGAIGLLLGNKGDSIVVRNGCSEAEVIGLLSVAADNYEALDWLQSCEIPVEQNPEQNSAQNPEPEQELSVRRILKDNGKSSCYIQHIPVSLSKLTEFMALLFDLHSQHQNQSLFHSRQQLRLLDHYAQLGGRVEQFGKTFQDINQKKKLLAEAKEAAKKQQEQAEYLHHAVEEITALKPLEDEDVQLSEQIELLSNSETIREQLEQLIDSGAQALRLLSDCQSELTELVGKLSAVKELLPRLQSACIEVEDILDSCKAEKNQMHVNPGQLQELDQRLSKLILLSRKYGNSSLNETLRFRDEATAKLAEAEDCEDSIARQQQDIQVAEKMLMQEAQYLSQQRKKYAAILQQNIEANLHNLGMTQARFQIELTHRNNENGHVLCHSYGIDKVRFLLAANPGESFHEIQQVASGGEISRIMLAIKSDPAFSSEGGPAPSLAENKSKAEANGSSIETIIFDEIDTGIGGETGIRLAEHIHRLGQSRQVLCVTHLASVAASANNHIKIEKQSDASSTKVDIYQLAQQQRPAELARMLSGDAKNPASLAHAEELLNRYLIG